MLQSLIDVEGPPSRALAGLRPTATHEEIRGGLRARLAYDDVVAGDTTRVAMVLTDSETGGLATDLRMFLGAAGHFIGVSDDSDEVIHAHAEAGETVHPRQDYEIRFPRAGRWSVWLQVQRGDAVVTFPFAINRAAESVTRQAARPSGRTARAAGTRRSGRDTSRSIAHTASAYCTRVHQ